MITMKKQKIKDLLTGGGFVLMIVGTAIISALTGIIATMVGIIMVIIGLLL